MNRKTIIKQICYILANLQNKLIVLSLLITLNPGLLKAKETSNSEIKASWIYTITNWLNFKERPRLGKQTICTTGRDKVYMHLKRLKRQSNNNFHIQNKSPSDNFDECHILYISDSEQEYYTNILNNINTNKGIITVSSISGFARRGGAVEFVIKKKARLIINLKTTKEANVVVDDEFYGWAETIH